MISLHTILAVIALLSTTTAVPTLSSKVPSIFTVNQVPRKAVNYGPNAYLKSMSKWNGSAEKIANLTSKTLAPGGVTATPKGPDHIDEQYVCQVMIGNQRFSLDLDTGSSDLYASLFSRCGLSS